MRDVHLTATGHGHSVDAFALGPWQRVVGVVRIGSSHLGWSSGGRVRKAFGAREAHLPRIRSLATRQLRAVHLTATGHEPSVDAFALGPWQRVVGVVRIGSSCLCGAGCRWIGHLADAEVGGLTSIGLLAARQLCRVAWRVACGSEDALALTPWEGVVRVVGRRVVAGLLEVALHHSVGGGGGGGVIKSNGMTRHQGHGSEVGDEEG